MQASIGILSYRTSHQAVHLVAVQSVVPTPQHPCVLALPWHASSRLHARVDVQPACRLKGMARAMSEAQTKEWCLGRRVNSRPSDAQWRGAGRGTAATSWTTSASCCRTPRRRPPRSCSCGTAGPTPSTSSASTCRRCAAGHCVQACYLQFSLVAIRFSAILSALWGGRSAGSLKATLLAARLQDAA